MHLEGILKSCSEQLGFQQPKPKSAYVIWSEAERMKINRQHHFAGSQDGLNAPALTNEEVSVELGRCAQPVRTFRNCTCPRQQGTSPPGPARTVRAGVRVPACVPCTYIADTYRSYVSGVRIGRALGTRVAPQALAAEDAQGATGLCAGAGVRQGLAGQPKAEP